MIEPLAGYVVLGSTGIGARFGIGGLKVGLDLLGGYGGSTRMPLPMPDADGVEEIREILATTGLL